MKHLNIYESVDFSKGYNYYIGKFFMKRPRIDAMKIYLITNIVKGKFEGYVVSVYNLNNSEYFIGPEMFKDKGSHTYYTANELFNKYKKKVSFIYDKLKENNNSVRGLIAYNTFIEELDKSEDLAIHLKATKYNL